MELRHVKYFVVVAEELHFGHAVKRLGIALVSRLIQRWRIPGVVYRELDKPIRATDVALVWNASSRSQPVELFLRTALRVFPEPLADPGPPLRKS